MLQCSIFCSHPKFIFFKEEKKRGINIENNTIQYNTIQYNTIQYNTIKCNTILYIQYNIIYTIQYTTIYNTVP